MKGYAKNENAVVIGTNIVDRGAFVSLKSRIVHHADKINVVHQSGNGIVLERVFEDVLRSRRIVGNVVDRYVEIGK